MSFLIFLVQIGELLKGNFNWRGVLHLFLFIVMGLIIIAFSAFFVRIIIRSKEK